MPLPHTLTVVTGTQQVRQPFVDMVVVGVGLWDMLHVASTPSFARDMAALAAALSQLRAAYEEANSAVKLGTGQDGMQGGEQGGKSAPLSLALLSLVHLEVDKLPAHKVAALTQV